MVAAYSDFFFRKAKSNVPQFKNRKLSFPSYGRKLVKGWFVNPLSTNPTKWSDTLKQFVSKLSTNCLSVFDHFVGLALEGL